MITLYVASGCSWKYRDCDKSLSIITARLTAAFITVLHLNKLYIILLQVRRAALQKLLDEDIQKYEKELHSQGKAFYMKRT